MNNQKKRELMLKFAAENGGNWIDKDHHSIIESTGFGTMKKGELKSSVVDNHDDLDSRLFNWVCTRSEFDELMKEIADNAPEEADVFHPRFGKYYRKKRDEYVCCNDNSRFLHPSCEYNLIHLRSMFYKKWMPEIGQECEYNSEGHHSGWEWCIYRGLMSDGGLIIEYHHQTALDRVTCDCFDPDFTYFRPISTEAEKEREELYEMAITQIETQGMDSSVATVHDAIEFLLDGGMICRPEDLKNDETI